MDGGGDVDIGAGNAFGGGGEDDHVAHRADQGRVRGCVSFTHHAYYISRLQKKLTSTFASLSPPLSVPWNCKSYRGATTYTS